MELVTLVAYFLCAFINTAWSCADYGEAGPGGSRRCDGSPTAEFSCGRMGEGRVAIHHQRSPETHGVSNVLFLLWRIRRVGLASFQSAK